MFSVPSSGVSCSKGCCRRFGRIFGRCRLFEIIDNILNETLLLIRWPINRSNRFSVFLRLDRLDPFGKIIKSIFAKFWKRKFQFFSDFQNFFGFLKFLEKYFFWYRLQISRGRGKCRCSLFVNVDRYGPWDPWFETDHSKSKFA